jgi:hypothetical protein
MLKTSVLKNEFGFLKGADEFFAAAGAGDAHEYAAVFASFGDLLRVFYDGKAEAVGGEGGHAALILAL